MNSINIKNLHKFALEKLPPTSILREAILVEKENLTPSEFLAKLDVWLVLFRRENGL